MKSASAYSLLNVGIKVSTNGLRLVFLLILPQFINMESFGVYALILASVTLCAYLLGKFHYDSNRRILIPAAIHRRQSAACHKPDRTVRSHMSAFLRWSGSPTLD